MVKSTFQKSLEEKLTTLLSPVVEEEGCELVELQYVQRKSNALLRLLVDKVGGVTLDHCSRISHKVEPCLDNEDLLDSRYTLEVSSPGLERPLASPADFRRKVGENVRVSVLEADKSIDVVGEIVRVDEEKLFLRTAEGERSLLFTQIGKGKIVF